MSQLASCLPLPLAYAESNFSTFIRILHLSIAGLIDWPAETLTQGPGHLLRQS